MVPVWVNAVLAIVVQLVLKVPQALTDMTAQTVLRVNLVIAVPLLHHNPNCLEKSLNNARAKLLPVKLALQDPKVPTDHPVMLVPLVLMANQEIKVHVVQLDLQVLLVKTAKRVLQVIMVKSCQAKLAPLVNPVHLVNQVLKAPLANPVRLEKMVPLVLPVQQEMLVLQAVQAKLAVQVPQANPAKLVPPEAATTAHLLAWLLVIKRCVNQRSFITKNVC